MLEDKFSYDIRKFWLYSFVFYIVFTAFVITLFWFYGFFDAKANAKNHLLFEYPYSFYLLFIVPIYTFLQFRALKRRNKMVFTIANPNLQPYLFNPVNTSSAILQFLLLKSVLIFLIFAIASPIYGKKKQDVQASNLELVICLDVSNSMNTKDVDGVSRLDASKRALSQLINKLSGERIGICVFAGSAFVQLPLTIDYHAAKLFVQEIETEMVSSQGTNISEALVISNNMFTKLKSSKGIFMLTDGEDHIGLEDSVIGVLSDRKVEISILGIGSENGGPVPVDIKRPGLGYKKTSGGEQVISRLNQEFIKSLAEKLNGNASLTNQAFPNINEVLTEINQMKKENLRNLEIEISESWYQIPLVMGILSFALLFIHNTVRLKKK